MTLLTLTGSQSAAGQYGLSAFHPLTVPPATAGTCEPIAPRPRADGTTQTGARLIMKNRSPGRDRQLQVLVDGAGHTTAYSELLIASTGPLRGESDQVVAFFDAHGGVKGFRTHQATELPPGPVGVIDTAALHAGAIREARKTVPITLESGDQRRVKIIADWLRKRCAG